MIHGGGVVPAGAPMPKSVRVESKRDTREKLERERVIAIMNSVYLALPRGRVFIAPSSGPKVLLVGWTSQGPLRGTAKILPLDSG